MKRLIYCALFALIAISCEKLENPLENLLVIPQDLTAYTPEFESENYASKSSVLREYLPESWNGPSNINTRTYAIPDPDPDKPNQYLQYWSPGDNISVFFTDKNLKYTLSNLKDDDEDNDDDVNNDYGLFHLVGEAGSGLELSTENYYAVYPYKENTGINYESGVITYNFPKNQHYSNDSYSNEENGMLAFEQKAAYDGKFHFLNFCSYLQLRLYAYPKQETTSETTQDTRKIVKQIILVANNSNDKITGDASITVVNSEPVVEMKMTATNQIVLDCCNGVELSQDPDEPTKFWFVLPGDFTFTNGFEVTVTFNDNSYFKKSTLKPISIERSHIKPMAAFNTIEEDGDDIILSGPIRYKYNDPSLNEPYPIGGEFYGEDGTKLHVINQIYDELTGEWVVYLSGKLKTIGGNNFQTLSPNIEYIKIEENTENPIIISDFAFFNSTAETLMINNDIESIGSSAIMNSTIASISIKGNVSVIKENAFHGSMYLTSFEATSVNTISQNAFQMCFYLNNFTTSGIEYIGSYAFLNCISLKNLNLDSVIKIEDAAFMGCSGLTTVSIAETCIMIGEGAFCNTLNLKEVYCYATKPPFIKTDNSDGSFVFNPSSPSLCIYIPVDALSKYTDPNYFVNNESGYEDPIKYTVNWWYQEYSGKIQVMM